MASPSAPSRKAQIKALDIVLAVVLGVAVLGTAAFAASLPEITAQLSDLN